MGKTRRPPAKWVVTMWLVYSVAPVVVGGGGWDDEEHEKMTMAAAKAEVLKQTASEAMKDVAAAFREEGNQPPYLNSKNTKEPAQRLIDKAVDGTASETNEISTPAASESVLHGAGKMDYAYEEWKDLKKKEIATHGL